MIVQTSVGRIVPNSGRMVQLMKKPILVNNEILRKLQDIPVKEQTGRVFVGLQGKQLKSRSELKKGSTNWLELNRFASNLKIKFRYYVK